MKNKMLHKQRINETSVEVNLPLNIQIELVQGNELRTYEIFSWITGLTISIAVGFWTAYYTNDISNNPIKFSAITFTIFSIITFIIMLIYRSKLYDGKIKKITPLSNFK